ncbi:MAG: hypothetical protein FWF94_07785 [Oscillospiraceae bacterium]|nr:hypothetical protein [Oscillospiraceae bacterium]
MTFPIFSIYTKRRYNKHFHKNQINLIQYPAGKTEKSYTVLSGVTSIGENEGEPTIFCFIEILLYLVKIPSGAEDNSAAILSKEGKAAGHPTVFCEIEILLYLVGLTDGSEW